MLNLNSPDLARLLANAQNLLNARRFADAEALLRQALTIHPNHPAANHMLGMVLLFTSRHDQAISAFQTALAAHPVAEVYLHLIQLYQFTERTPKSLALAREARAKYPNDDRVACELGRVLERTALFDEAMTLYERSVMLWPKVARTWLQYGSLLFFQGQISRAVEVYRKGVAANPADAPLHSALLYTLHFLPGLKPADLLREHQAWAQRHAKPLEKTHQPFANARDPEKRLRIGYVSPNFRNHSVGRFITPLLAAHDHTRFEIFAYSDVHTPDIFTQRAQAAVDIYRPCMGMPNDLLAQQIRSDGIDILVDLTMHMPGAGGGRMLLFARQPAPVQACYLAYVSTTGLPAMHYRLSDPQLDPPPAAGSESWSTETTIRLPSYWCYEAIPNSPPPLRTPGGPLTFACLNNLAKVSDAALEAWSRILQPLPHAQLLLHCIEGQARDLLSSRLSRAGITPDRVRFAGRLPLPEFLALHQQADIALDPFPYGGGTTTCDALYMGLPVITLADPSPETLPVGRGGASLLTQLALSDLIAHNVNDYIHLALNLAQNPARLAELRATLRPKMAASPLMNAPHFARTIEEAYRTMWRQYLSSHPQ